MKSATGVMIPERAFEEPGALETTRRDQFDALLYPLFVAGLGVLFVCARVVHWPFSRERLTTPKSESTRLRRRKLTT